MGNALYLFILGHISQINFSFFIFITPTHIFIYTRAREYIYQEDSNMTVCNIRTEIKQTSLLEGAI